MNRRFALFISLLFALTLIVSASTAASSYTIDAPVTSGTKMSASEWFASAKTRAMLTLSVSVDTISNLSDSDSDSYTSFWTNPSWVGISKSKQQVMVVGYITTSANTTVLVMIYTPGSGEIEYMPIVSTPALSDANAEMICMAALANDSTGDYEKNDPVEILSIIADLQ